MEISVEEEDVKEKKLFAEIDAVAEDILQFETGGLCHLGIICDLCDCFLNVGNLEAETQAQRRLATYILEQIKRRHGIHG